MRTFSGALLALHIVFGTAAIIGGLVALLSPKLSPRGGRVHRRAGRAFLWCIGVVIASAVGLTIISFNPYFAGLTAAAAIGVFSGYRVLGRKRPDLNPDDRAKPLDWAVTLTLAAVAVMLLIFLRTGRITENIPVVNALGYGTLGYAIYDLYRFWRPLGIPFGPNLWLYEHLVKMIGAYFGAVAAFSGSVLVLLDPPWRQLWATVLGQWLSIVLVIYYRVKLGRRDDARRAEARLREV